MRPMKRTKMRGKRRVMASVESLQESDRQEEKERDQRSRMHSVEESLLQRRHSVGNETAGRERATTEERDIKRKREGAMNKTGRKGEELLRKQRC
jgi:hypothetical protein